MVKPKGQRLVRKKDLKLLLQIGKRRATPTVIDVYTEPGRDGNHYFGP